MNIYQFTGCNLDSKTNQSLWRSLHTIAINYPVNPTDDQIKEADLFVTTLYKFVKCSRCARHTADYIDNNYNIEICKSQESFFKFFWEFHNSVNNRLNKKIISYEDALKLYNINLKS